MTQITFIPIDYDYFDFNGRNYAKIIGRTDKNKKACIIDSCDVYFWAILHDNLKEKDIQKLRQKIEKIEIEKNSRQSSVLKTEIHEKNYLGKKVKAIKIFVTNFKDAHAIADEMGFKEIAARREYDLPFITKYIIERKLKPLTWYEIEGEILNNSEEFGGIDSSLDVDLCLKVEKIKETKQISFKPKVLAFDIEADEFEIGKGKVIMISLVGENFKKVLTCCGNPKKSHFEKFKDEEELIKNFTKQVKEYDPDILIGYFSDGFDLPYLRARAEKNHIKLNLGIDGSQPSFSRGNMLTAKIKGIVHIDLYKFIRTAYSQYLSSETLSLNDVASELLGEKKHEFEFKHSSKIKEEEFDRYFEYNLQDSILTYKLMEKTLPDLMEFSKIIQEPLFDISRDGMSANVENYIIHNLERFNEIVEKRPIYDEIGERREREKYEGAFVFTPTPGLYENLCFFDFTSMHASIIVSFNISKSTLLEKKDKNSYESPEVELNGKKQKFYFSKTPSFFPTLLGEIVELRKKYKKELKQAPDPFKKARSNAFKLLANAYYGYLGFFGARYYSIESAASTLAFVRKFNHDIIDKTNKEGFKVIYADTDSVAFTLENKTKKQTLDFLEKLNKELPGIMELELEDFYKRGIWVTKRTGDFGAKKKYALINEQNKLKIRGFETVRRDWCDLARETQNKVLEYILKEGNEKKAIEYVKEIIKKLKSREIKLNELMIRTQLKKPIEEYKAESPHVSIAKKMQALDLPVKIGMLIEYFITEPESHQKTKTGNTKGPIRERAKMPDESGEYDIDYYLNNQILPAVENILEIFNLNAKEMLNGKKQKTLGEF